MIRTLPRWSPFALCVPLIWGWPSADAPSARHHHKMVLDGARERIVLFGGNVEGGNGWTADTWEWDGEAWHEADGDGASPPGVSSHAMAYDAARERTLLFGGARTDRSLAGTTWQWNGASWQAHEGDGPSARHSPAMGYDAARQVVVLFGGSGRGSDAQWEWDGQWHAIELPEDHPPPLMRAGFSFDPNRRAMLLFGGYLGSVHGDTWSWDGEAWTRLEVEGPTPRANAAMATDPVRNRVVLFGGSDSNHELYRDTWEWDGERWEQCADSGPAPRTVPAMAYDPDSKRILLHGGRGAARQAYGDLWAWDGETWTEVAPR
ncbi:MAG: hypothetical protein AAF628_08030 [Planctomycetota bacterium]